VTKHELAKNGKETVQHTVRYPKTMHWYMKEEDGWKIKIKTQA
jgi:hypothetical protein